MAIYVDELWAYSQDSPDLIFCHLIADRGHELREVGEVMELPETALHGPKFPHYRINAKERQQAIDLGAVPLERQTYTEAVADIEKLVREGKYGTYRP